MGIFWAVIALVGLGVVVGVIHFVQNLGRAKRIAQGLEVEEVEEQLPVSGGCCGMHMTCERDSLLAAVSSSIVYYDDEELDRYIGMASRQYSESEIEEFRNVLITLQDDDVAGWVRSLQLRGIEIPDELKSEVFLIVGENRAYHMKYGSNKDH